VALGRADAWRYRGCMDAPGAVIRTQSRSTGWARFRASLRPARLVFTLCLAAIVAGVLNPIFITAFPILLARTLFIGVLSLLAFSAAGQWPKTLPSWLPRWVVQVLVVALSLPLGTLLVYLFSVDGDWRALMQHDARLTGLVSITGVGLLVGPLLAMAALYRERDAQARSQTLAFELEKSQLERQALDARLRLMQAQIEPHFLLNTLANVRALVETGSPQAGPVLGSLIAYLRGAMPRLREQAASLGDELALVRAYLELMQMRMPDRLQYSVDVPVALEALRFPPMALLTLVENAVRHGIDPSEVGGRVDVGAASDGTSGVVSVWVTDTGVGMSQLAGTGSGLRNLRERLGLFYGVEACIDFSEPSPHGLRAELKFKP